MAFEIWVVITGDFLAFHLFGNTVLNSWRTLRVLFHCQTSSVWSIIQPKIVLQTNNACKSLNFIIQIRTLLRKFNARFSHFMVSLIDPLKRLLWLNFAPNLHCWTLNYQHAYAECELKQISQLYRSMVMMTIIYRFIAVRSNWASVTQQRGQFCGRI